MPTSPQHSLDLTRNNLTPPLVEHHEESDLSPSGIPLSCIRDDGLRRSIEAAGQGTVTAQTALSLFHEQVIRQHNLLSTATDQERHATLERLLDWWNHIASSAMTNS